MCVYMCACVHVCVCVCMCACMRACLPVCLFVYLYSMYALWSVQYVCMCYVCMYISSVLACLSICQSCLLVN